MKASLILAVFVLGTGLAAVAGLPSSIQGFSTWTIVATGLKSGGEHSGKDKRVYANPVASQVWRGKAAMPVGSVIVKAPGDPKNAKWVAIMQKTSKGWQYQEFMASGAGYVPAKETQAECIECHSRAKSKDYLFSRK